MYTVTNDYKTGMKSQLRERSYIMISFGLINQEAQRNAVIDLGDFAYFSDEENVFKQNRTLYEYATLENDYTKVDGTMYFPPQEGYALDTSLVSKNPVDSTYSLRINLNTLPTDLKGLTIDFGEFYPTNFNIKTDNGQEINVSGNDKSIYTTETVLTDVKTIVLTVQGMNGKRLRINSILLGFGLVYTNDNVIESQLDTYVSPIAESVSQSDFSVKLSNYNKYFNVDNPKSAINFLETGQEMSVSYGYYIKERDEIEWVKGGTLLCSEWESDDETATIKGQDIFRTLDGQYYKGKYYSDEISLYDLAVLIFEDAGIESYYVDPYLKDKHTKNPMPRVTHREALQIIANAGRCVLSTNRDGIPQIVSSFIPDFSVSNNGAEPYSNTSNISSPEEKREYASLMDNYTIPNGNIFLPSNGNYVSDVGYVSKQISDEDGLFVNYYLFDEDGSILMDEDGSLLENRLVEVADETPILHIELESAKKFYGLRMLFGNALPAAFSINTYLVNELVDSYFVSEEFISKDFILSYEFSTFDSMDIEFYKTQEPYNRIVLNYFTFGDIVGFTMERMDMTSSPKSIKQELIKEVDVSCYLYNTSSNNEALVTNDVTVVSGEKHTYFLNDAAYNLSATVNGGSGATIVNSGAYYCEIQFSVTGSYRLEIKGNKYNITSNAVVNSLNNRGKVITWNNPLISDYTMADELAEWLAEYYSANVEYEYDTRGNPELDTGDIIYQENDFMDDLKVNVYRHSVKFSTSLSGKVTARRVG